MKRCLLLMLCLLLVLCGCEQVPEMENPVRLYYLAAKISYGTLSSTIEAETRECGAMTGTEEILRAYLAGPQDEQLRSPFPAGLTLLELRQEDGTVYLTFSQELASMTNLDLTLACSCIAMTCLELTGAEQVSIEAEGSLLGGQKSITLDHASLYLTDNSAQGE